MSLPVGTVTFLFSDIEGSTSLVRRLGDDYGPLLSQHRRVMRETASLNLRRSRASMDPM
jgi:class 3 adenylate cyclase